MRMKTTTETRSDRSDRDEQVWLPIYGAADSSQKQAPKKGGEGEGAKGDGAGPQKLAKKGKELKEDMDALVDEIDEVLEENAEEFVKNYVQRGGQ